MCGTSENDVKLLSLPLSLFTNEGILVVVIGLHKEQQNMKVRMTQIEQTAQRSHVQIMCGKCCCYLQIILNLVMVTFTDI